MTEEVLLEALCFDFVVDSPHYDLVGMFETHDIPPTVQEHALSIANDSCVLVSQFYYYDFANSLPATVLRSVYCTCRGSLQPPATYLPSV
jgi:hypothetical protein